MADKTLKTRIQHKRGSLNDWNQATNFTPLDGELIVYNEKNGTPPKFKVGDGATLVGNLPFATVENDSHNHTTSTITDFENSVNEIIENSGAVIVDDNGKISTSALPAIPQSLLPSYVDDVLEYNSKSAFPAKGETGKIYVSTDTNLTYRWSGSTYTEISPSLALGETNSTAYAGDKGAAAYKHAVTNKGIAKASGLYKITTNSEGHVTAASAVTKQDILNLGIVEGNGENVSGNYLPLIGGTMTGSIKTTKTSQAFVMGNSTNPTLATLSLAMGDLGTRTYFTHYDENSSYYDNFVLPGTKDLTENGNYWILTTKSPVSVAQGGTGATNVESAMNNLNGRRIFSHYSQLGLTEASTSYEIWAALPRDSSFIGHNSNFNQVTDTPNGYGVVQIVKTNDNYGSGTFTRVNTDEAVFCWEASFYLNREFDGWKSVITERGGTITGTLTTGNLTISNSNNYSYLYLANQNGDNIGGLYASDSENRLYLINHAPNSTAGKYEGYGLPAVTTDNLTDHRWYSILTSKNPVTVAQGGTGATTAEGARTALGITDNKVAQTLTNNSTSSTMFYLLAGTSASTTTAGSIFNNHLRANIKEGTTNAEGFVELYLGSATAKGSAGNKTGKIALYSNGTNYHLIIPSNNSITTNITHTLPTVSGTFLNTGNYENYITPANIEAAPTSHASTTTNYGLSTTTLYGHAMASSTTPKALGATASVGSETAKFARGDHVHPLPALTSCTGTLTVAKGGTGATNAATAMSNLKGRQIFTSYSQLGLTEASTSYEIWAALPADSSFIAHNSNNSQVTDTPVTYGIVQITKTSTNYGVGYYSNVNADPKIYNATFYLNRTFDGWKQVITETEFTDNKVAQTSTNPTTSTKYYPLVGSSSSNTTAGAVFNTAFNVNFKNGTASAEGNIELILGNSTATGTAGNKTGWLCLYSPGTSYHMIKPASTNSALTHTLPAVSGTILNSGNYQNYAKLSNLGDVVVATSTPSSVTNGKWYLIKQG